VEVSPLHPGALHRGHGVRGDEPIRDRLAERRAQHASRLCDGGGRQSTLLHPGEDRPDVRRPYLGELKPADDRDDLSADVALVRDGPGADPSHPLIVEPPDQVRGEADPLRAPVASTYRMNSRRALSASFLVAKPLLLFWRVCGQSLGGG
jgi:hypothetical protein